MNKLFKIIMVLTLLVSNITSVNALESNNDLEVIVEEETQDVITVDVLDAIPSKITLEMTEKEALDWIARDSYSSDEGVSISTGNYRFINEVTTIVKEQVDENEYYVNVSLNEEGAIGGTLNIRQVYVEITNKNTRDSQSKFVEITYTNSGDYNQTDYTKAINSASVFNDLLKKEDGYYTYAISPKDYDDTNYFDKYISGDIELIRTRLDGAMSENYECLFFFINDVLYYQYYIITSEIGYLTVPSDTVEGSFTYLQGLGDVGLNQLLEEQLDLQYYAMLADKYGVEYSGEFVPFEGLVSIEKLNDDMNYHFKKMDSNLGLFKLTDKKGTSQIVYLLSNKSDEDNDSTNPETPESDSNKTTITDGVYLDGDYDGIVIASKDLNKEDETYIDMTNYLSNKGFTNILNGYEFTLESGDISKGVKITFEVGTEYNSKNAMVLHKKQDGTYEEFKSVVTNGKVSINVTELSPFVVAIEDNQELTTPNTSDNSLMLLSGCLSLLAISLFLMKKTAIAK